MRAIGVQSFDIGGGQRLIGFGVSTWHRWSNASTTEFDIFVDVDPQNANGDDYIVVGVDNGAIAAGVFNGLFDAYVFSTRSGGASSPRRVTRSADRREHGIPADHLQPAVQSG